MPMETLFTRHRPKRGMVCLMMVGSLVLHGGLVGIASLWTPPQPPERTVPFDWSPPPTGGEDPIRPTTDVSQPNPPETPPVTATPEVIDPVVPAPPVTEEPLFSDPTESSLAPHRAVAVRPSVSANRPTSGPAVSRASAGPSGGGTPGNGNPAGLTGSWVMPHPPYLRMLGRPAVAGQTTVRITTDATGRVSNVVIVKSTGNPALDNHTTSYVRNNWRGPANASRTTEFVYETK